MRCVAIPAACLLVIADFAILAPEGASPPSHLFVRRYDSTAAEKVGECTPGAEGQHAGCEQRHRIDAERLCARLRTTWRDFAAMRAAGVWTVSAR